MESAMMSLGFGALDVGFRGSIPSLLTESLNPTP